MYLFMPPLYLVLPPLHLLLPPLYLLLPPLYLQVEQTSPYMKKNAISVIGAVALSVKEHMAPYFEQIVTLLKAHLLENKVRAKICYELKKNGLTT